MDSAQSHIHSTTEGKCSPAWAVIIVDGSIVQLVAYC